MGNFLILFLAENPRFFYQKACISKENIVYNHLEIFFMKFGQVEQILYTFKRYSFFLDMAVFILHISNVPKYAKVSHK